MRAIWNIISPAAFSELVFEGGGRTRPLTVVRRTVARGMRLTVDPRDATVRLTLGARAPLRPALAWAAGKRSWVEAELARLPMPQPIVPGMVFRVGDDAVVLDWSAELPRRVFLDRPQHRDCPLGDCPSSIKSATVPKGAVTDDNPDAILSVGGPLDQLSARVLRFLRAHALKVLDAETRALAEKYGITVGAISVGDAKSRWGSCAASGNIRYSWRLILAPAFVRHSTVAHEVAHRVYMNHGPAFHKLAKELVGTDPAPARAWLRTHGPSLYWFGRDG